MFTIRKLKFKNNNNTFKIEDTTTTIEIYALDDDKQVVFDKDDKLEIKIKNSSGYLMTIVPDVTDDSKTVNFSSAQLENLPVGYYQFELRVNNNAIFPNEGFLSFEITKNATDITGEVISSITLHDFEEKINQLADNLQARADNGDFDGQKGDKGDPGTNTDPNAVHVSGNQTISGVKNFIDTPTVNGNKVLDDSLQIGGRNYLLGTANPITLIGDGKHKAREIYQVSDKEAIRGKGIVFSFNISKTEGTNDEKIMVLVGGTNQWIETVSLADIPVNASKRVIIYRTMLDKEIRGDIGFETVSDSFNGSVTVSNVQLELGTKPTDWTPAPEDSHHHQAFRKGTRFFAHRGAQSIAPENSLPAIRKAGNHAGVEIDIHQTSDGRWVIMHDGTVNRTTDGSGAVSSFTFAELRKLKLKDPVDSRTNPFSDSELVVPSLEEALVECKNQRLIPVIEIKVDGTDNYTSDSYDSLATIIENYGLEDEIMFISFDYKALQSIKQRLPLVEVSYLVHTISDDLMTQAKQLGVNSGLDSNYTAAGVTATNVAKCHSLGLKVGVWTLADDSQRTKLIGMGVDFITTNSLSGERRWAQLSYRGSYEDYVNNQTNYRSVVQEISAGIVNVQFILQTNIASSAPLKKGTPFATLPSWAVPNYRLWNQCMVRTSTGFAPATFDIEGNSLLVGFDWDKKSTNGWISGNVTYHV